MLKVLLVEQLSMNPKEIRKSMRIIE